MNNTTKNFVFLKAKNARLKKALKLAVGFDCSDNFDSWKYFIHEKYCNSDYKDPHNSLCKCDGKYIMEQVERVLNETDKVV